MTRNIMPWRKNRETSLAREEERPLVELHQRMNELFDSFFEGWGLTSQAPAAQPWSLSPRIDVSETDDEVRVAAELPGMDEKDIEVTLENGLLTIRGHKKQEKEEKKRNYHLVECSYGEFHRAVPLPVTVDEGKTRASFKKGVLTVTVPKTAEAKSRQRKIDILSE